MYSVQLNWSRYAIIYWLIFLLRFGSWNEKWNSEKTENNEWNRKSTCSVLCVQAAHSRRRLRIRAIEGREKNMNLQWKWICNAQWSNRWTHRVKTIFNYGSSDWGDKLAQCTGRWFAYGKYLLWSFGPIRVFFLFRHICHAVDSFRMLSLSRWWILMGSKCSGVCSKFARSFLSTFRHSIHFIPYRVVTMCMFALAITKTVSHDSLDVSCVWLRIRRPHSVRIKLWKRRKMKVTLFIVYSFCIQFFIFVCFDAVSVALLNEICLCVHSFTRHCPVPFLMRRFIRNGRLSSANCVPEYFQLNCVV